MKKIPVEEMFDRFIKQNSGQKISELVGGNPSFQNADYLFKDNKIIAELKTLQTDFAKAETFQNKRHDLIRKYISEGKMEFRNLLNPSELPKDYLNDVIRIFRPALSRIIKKANVQIRETKEKLKFPDSSGLLILVNDDFISLEPQFIISLISDILIQSYSSVDGFVYLTLNHYVELPHNDLDNLIWIPGYSDKAHLSLSDFVDKLGNQWQKFLEIEIGEFDSNFSTENSDIIIQAKSIKRNI